MKKILMMMMVVFSLLTIDTYSYAIYVMGHPPDITTGKCGTNMNMICVKLENGLPGPDPAPPSQIQSGTRVNLWLPNNGIQNGPGIGYKGAILTKNLVSTNSESFEYVIDNETITYTTYTDWNNAVNGGTN